MLREDCVKVTRTENGERKHYLLTPDGLEKPLDFCIKLDRFNNDRCAFNAEEWKGECPNKEFYWEADGVNPGKWGFINSNGEIVIEPKYVYAVGFWEGGGEHSVVARYVDEKLRWGVIDLNGVEVIPCIYPALYCGLDNAVAFQLKEYGPLGLMDFSGNVLVPPQFEHIEAYNPQHRLITTGKDGDNLGVYSIDLGRMIIPTEFDYVKYCEDMICCEIQYTCNDKCFDYNGVELDLNHYDSSDKAKGQGIDCHKKEYMITEKQHMYGLSKASGEVILPEIFNRIIFRGNFAIAHCNSSSNDQFYDTLYTLNGDAVLSGLYRSMDINSNVKPMPVETPTGLEFLAIDESNKTIK